MTRTSVASLLGLLLLPSSLAAEAPACAPPAGSGGAEVTLNAATHSFQGDVRFATRDRVRVEVTNKNPFRFAYELKVDEKEVPDALGAIVGLFPFVGEFRALEAEPAVAPPAPAPPAGGPPVPAPPGSAAAFVCDLLPGCGHAGACDAFRFLRLEHEALKSSRDALERDLSTLHNAVRPRRPPSSPGSRS